MPTTRKRGAAIAAATLGLLLSGAFSGCSIGKDDPKKAEASSPAEPTPTVTEEPSETPSATASPSGDATASATPAATPEASLLAAAVFPQLNDSSPWTEGRTTVPGPSSFGLCQQFDTLSIGAMSVIERSYKTGTSGEDTAGQQVAEFPDAQNTVRASKVLEAWQRECKGQVRGSNVKVRPITNVAVAKGKGWWYLVSYVRGGTGHFHSFGVAFSGNRMTLLKINHAGQDHNYEPGQDPMELAVKAASAKMTG
jgi:hypothetical protein